MQNDVMTDGVALLEARRANHTLEVARQGGPRLDPLSSQAMNTTTTTTTSLELVVEEVPAPAYRSMRPTGEFCPGCGAPIFEVCHRGEWMDAPCLPCLQRQQQAEFLAQLVEEQAQRAALYPTATFDAFVVEGPHQKRGLAAARAFLAEITSRRPLALVLYAAPTGQWTGRGTGKTHLASAIANAVQKRGWRVTSWVMPELMAMLRSSYGPGNDEGGGIEDWTMIRRAGEADLLVLDDVGAEHFKDWGWYQEKLYLILNRRTGRGPVVITSNLDKGQIPGWIGTSAFSRLWQMTRQGELVVDMSGPDWRWRL